MGSEVGSEVIGGRRWFCFVFYNCAHSYPVAEQFSPRYFIQRRYKHMSTKGYILPLTIVCLLQTITAIQFIIIQNLGTA